MYKTTDVNVSAYLVATGHELLGVEGEGPRRMFVFADPAGEAVPAYHHGAQVPAKEFARAMRALKRRLHAGHE